MEDVENICLTNLEELNRILLFYSIIYPKEKKHKSMTMKVYEI